MSQKAPLFDLQPRLARRTVPRPSVGGSASRTVSLRLQGSGLAGWPSEALSRDRLACWAVDCGPDSERLIAAVWTSLSEAEQDRANWFRFSSDRRVYVIAHAVLRFLLAMHLRRLPRSIEIVASTGGRPELATPGIPPLRFSLSHSRETAAIGLTQETAIGIDIEAVGEFPELMMLAHTYFAAGEIDALERCPARDRPAAFATIWTRKEAVLKALGVGLALPLDGFETGDPGGTPRLSSHQFELADWTVADLLAPVGYRACVAAPRPVTHVSLDNIDLEAVHRAASYW